MNRAIAPLLLIVALVGSGSPAAAQIPQLGPIRATLQELARAQAMGQDTTVASLEQRLLDLLQEARDHLNQQDPCRMEFQNTMVTDVLELASVAQRMGENEIAESAHAWLRRYVQNAAFQMRDAPARERAKLAELAQQLGLNRVGQLLVEGRCVPSACGRNWEGRLIIDARLFPTEYNCNTAQGRIHSELEFVLGETATGIEGCLYGRPPTCSFTITCMIGGRRFVTGCSANRPSFRAMVEGFLQGQRMRVRFYPPAPSLQEPLEKYYAVDFGSLQPLGVCPSCTTPGETTEAGFYMHFVGGAYTLVVASLAVERMGWAEVAVDLERGEMRRSLKLRPEAPDIPIRFQIRVLLHPAAADRSSEPE